MYILGDNYSLEKCLCRQGLQNTYYFPVKTQNLSVDADAEANSNKEVQEVDVEANLRKFAKLCDKDCAQNFATVISWLGALGLFVGFLLFPSNLEEERIYVLLASLIILLFSVTFKVFHRNVECC